MRQSSRKNGMKPGPSGLDPSEASLVPQPPLSDRQLLAMGRGRRGSRGTRCQLCHPQGGPACTRPVIWLAKLFVLDVGYSHQLWWQGQLFLPLRSPKRQTLLPQDISNGLISHSLMPITASPTLQGERVVKSGPIRKIKKPAITELALRAGHKISLISGHPGNGPHERLYKPYLLLSQSKPLTMVDCGDDPMNSLVLIQALHIPCIPPSYPLHTPCTFPAMLCTHCTPCYSLQGLTMWAALCLLRH